MGGFKQIKDYIDSKERNLEKVAQKALAKNIDFIIWLIQDNQLSKGIMSSGASAPPYKKATEDFAKDPTLPVPRKPKVAGEPWNYEWSGQWYDAMKVNIKRDGFDITSIAWKTRMLEQMSGGKLLKLTKENNKIINDEVILPALYEDFLNPPASVFN